MKRRQLKKSLRIKGACHFWYFWCRFDPLHLSASISAHLQSESQPLSLPPIEASMYQPSEKEKSSKWARNKLRKPKEAEQAYPLRIISSLYLSDSVCFSKPLPPTHSRPLYSQLSVDCQFLSLSCRLGQFGFSASLNIILSLPLSFFFLVLSFISHYS